MDNVRETALQLLLKTFKEDAYSNYLFESAVEAKPEWSEGDRAFLKALYLGVLRRMLVLDRLVGGKCRAPYGKVPDAIKMILRLGLYQILFMDRVPHSAAVSESVHLAKRYGHRGTAGMVNAILRRLSEEKGNLADGLKSYDRGSLALVSANTSHPLWLVERYRAELGAEQALAVLEANNEVPPRNFRVLDRDAFNALAEKAGATVERNRFNKLGAAIDKAPHGLAEKFTRGKIAFPQDESSLIAVSLMDGCAGNGLELCCGRGNKTGALMAYVDGRSAITAVDLSASKINVLKEMNEGALDRITPVCADVLKPMPFTEKFKWIFLDAPCSNLGTVRRHPEIRYRKTPESVREAAAVQATALANAATYMAEGGKLLYAVCSFEKEETVAVVEGFLSSHPGFRQADIAAMRPDIADAGLTDGKALRILPGRYGMDGFFAALFEMS